MTGFNDVFNYTFPTGHMFALNERVALSTSLPLLATSIKKRNLFLWGKILGDKKDYIVLKAFPDDLVSEEPELFYSVDEGLTFTLLGTTSSLLREIARQDEEVVERLRQDAARAGASSSAPAAQPARLLNMHDPLDVQEKKVLILKQMQGTFTGDPAYEYRISATPQDPAAPGSLRSIKESVRLALFVEEHDYHCRVAPRGAYYRVEKNVSEQSGGGSGGEVRRNSAFRGLRKAKDEAVSLRNYYHIRQANPYRKFLNTSENTSSALYFITGNREKNTYEKLAENQKIDAPFESLAVDIPSGLWQLKYDGMSDLVTGTHAYFPGSLFFHVPETAVYGNIYMGHGTIDNDVAFEI